jgi:ketosteroid isomerase-like protein
MSNAPAVIERYLKASDEHDDDTLVACFTDDATVVDENQTYVGHDAIRRWREGIAAKYTYTATVNEVARTGNDRYSASVHLEGDFPGGVVDLSYAFTLRVNRISALTI